ncbi:BTB/POZ domain-containing protein 6-like [Orbicella faveolata]|uniref:BTB/POZ domain-containing protein 6-like n=1 Tax=Orbicella faveolata TaxID=48498 RepID=UPI0009E6354B|nr:BTB/POZ domain-containing protein 6-like [Orbicella faveolata]
MSLDVASKDFWSATSRCTIGERCKFMFNNELLSDVKFVVRDAAHGSRSMKKIPAHKFLLAISSPVFYAMFYGELAEKKDSIDISDCDHESLLELFRFMYSDKVILNGDNVMQVLYLAKKYMLPSLADKCTEFLRENLDASNVFHVLPAAQTCEEKDLECHCWKVIDNQTDEAVKSDGFVTIKKSLLETLVERDSLNVKEVELFKAVDCWATKECEKQGQAAKGRGKRRILGERIVKAIRFPVMEQEAFADVVLDCDILTKEESFELMKYFNSLLKFPVGFSEVPRAGSHHNRRIISRFESLDKCNGVWSYSCYPNSTSYRDSMLISVDKSIMLHAVRLFGSEHNEYSVTLEVIDSNGVILATKTGKFLSELMQSERGKFTALISCSRGEKAVVAGIHKH